MNWPIESIGSTIPAYEGFAQTGDLPTTFTMAKKKMGMQGLTVPWGPYALAAGLWMVKLDFSSLGGGSNEGALRYRRGKALQVERILGHDNASISGMLWRMVGPVAVGSESG